MTQAQHKTIIDKIKKLFSLSRSPNEYESALALERARVLMLKYNIDNIDLVKDQVEDIIEIDFNVAARFTVPQETLSFWISQAFFCKSILVKGKQQKIRFIGSTSDIAVATFVFSYICDLLNTKSKEYVESLKKKNPKVNWRGRSAKIKKDYSFGFVDSISKKLIEIKKEHEQQNKYETEIKNQLIILKNNNVKKYVDDKYNDLKKGKTSISYNKNHFGAGVTEGSKHGIFRGVSNSSQIQIGQ